MDTIDQRTVLEEQSLAFPAAGLLLDDLCLACPTQNSLAVQRSQIAEAGNQLLGGLVVDERASALASCHNVLGLQKLQRFAHRAGAYAHFPSELLLVGNRRL